MKHSKQRDIIMEAVLENPIHPTADQVYRMLRQEHPSLSLGTVYRNLNLLASLGQLKKIAVNGEADRFDGNTAEHLHMRCTECGEISDIFTKALAGLDRKVAKETGEKILGHTIMFDGRCKNCRNAENEEDTR
ncbi:MAG: transcriptional repressor [Clostridiales Family XIII bacterium]|nr:transcriptional repressor [Clostridiales Family XIII bacterium]